MRQLLVLCVIVFMGSALVRAESGNNGGGGEGGAGGDGAVIKPPDIPLEKIVEYEKTLSAEQIRMLDEIIELERSQSRENGQAAKTNAEAIVAMRRQYLTWIVAGSGAQRDEFWTALPSQLKEAKRRHDPTFVSEDEKKAAANLPAEARKQVKALLSDDVDEYLRARKAVLDYEDAVIAPLSDVLQQLKEPSHKRTRVLSVLKEVHAGRQNEREKLLRVADAALKRRDELQAQNTGSRIAAVISRRLTSGRRETPLYGEHCYFSFPRASNDYNGATSIEFGNGGDEAISVNMYGGQANKISKLGAVDFASIVAAPDAASVRQWKDRCTAEAGHVYIEHCKEDRDNINAFFKFKVLELKPGQYMIIEWAPLPGGK
jgi:hypothetical protein